MQGLSSARGAAYWTVLSGWPASMDLVVMLAALLAMEVRRMSTPPTMEGRPSRSLLCATTPACFQKQCAANTSCTSSISRPWSTVVSCQRQQN